MLVSKEKTNRTTEHAKAPAANHPPWYQAEPRVQAMLSSFLLFTVLHG